jgi:hypothetical protein
LGREKRGETIVGLIIFTSLQLDKGSSCSQTSQREGRGRAGGIPEKNTFTFGKHQIQIRALFRLTSSRSG